MFNSNFIEMPQNPLGGQLPQQAWNQPPMQFQPPPAAPPEEGMEGEDGDNSKRPPNAFILYSQTMRPQVRQENPSLSNTECSRLLGKMWKEVPNEIKLQYKQKATQMQAEFKRDHPDYTYRKARRKRALNELLTKSSQGAGPGLFPPQFNGAPDGQNWQTQPGMFPFQGMQMPNTPSQPAVPGATGQSPSPGIPPISGMQASQPPAFGNLPAGQPSSIPLLQTGQQGQSGTQPMYQMPSFPPGIMNPTQMFNFQPK